MSFKRYYRSAFRYGTWKRFAFYYSQGNISNFADSRPEERRAIFEEAAGVSKYKKEKLKEKIKHPIFYFFRFKAINKNFWFSLLVLIKSYS